MSRLSRFVQSLDPFLRVARQGWIPPLQRPGFPIAVCWSAKAGCTTVLKWFLAHNGLLEEALAYSRWVHDYRQDKLFTARDYGRQCDRLMKRGRGSTTVIKVIRDPATRAVSSFLHFLRCGEDLTSWPGASLVGRWKKDAGLTRQPGLSFRQFLMFIATQQQRPVSLDVHFRPQSVAEQDARVDEFIRLEDLASGLEAIELRHGLPHVDVQRLSTSGHHNTPSANHAWPEAAAAFAADHRTLDQLGTPPARIFLDAETRVLIQLAYHVDYEAYGHFYGSSSEPDRDRLMADRTHEKAPLPALRRAA